MDLVGRFSSSRDFDSFQFKCPLQNIQTDLSMRGMSFVRGDHEWPERGIYFNKVDGIIQRGQQSSTCLSGLSEMTCLGRYLAGNAQRVLAFNSKHGSLSTLVDPLGIEARQGMEPMRCDSGLEVDNRDMINLLPHSQLLRVVSREH